MKKLWGDTETTFNAPITYGDDQEKNSTAWMWIVAAVALLVIVLIAI